MFCPKCGAPNDASARFCSTCGAALPVQQPMQSTQPVPVIVQQVRPAPVQLVPAHPTAYTHALTGCGRSLPYLFAAIALTAVAVLHLLDLLLGISGGIESVRTAIDASPSGLMQFLQAAVCFLISVLHTLLKRNSSRVSTCKRPQMRKKPLQNGAHFAAAC